MYILELIKSMDAETLKKSIASAKQFLQTKEGSEKAKSLLNGNLNTDEVPENLRAAAEAIKNDKAAKKALEGFLNKNG